ncbi:MAG: flavin reductase family protein [Syntrophomonadaceae bacterium]|nr:flavin reductase family protein [Syntrophomonadaceae bacterium]MDD3023396.1 flavin reductase family protein [Syntrophomonadaceae bacterium]
MDNKPGYSQFAGEMLKQLPKGIFLSVSTGEEINTMTIGWGSIGFMWQKPVIIVLVRPSRYTYSLLQKAQEFTVSIPLNSEMKKSLAIAGSSSGRDIDKFGTLNLTAQPGKCISSPVIGECGLIYECRVIFQQTMDPETLDMDIREKFYAHEDYHVMYFGEILACYKNSQAD